MFARITVLALCCLTPVYGQRPTPREKPPIPQQAAQRMIQIRAKMSHLRTLMTAAERHLDRLGAAHPVRPARVRELASFRDSHQELGESLANLLLDVGRVVEALSILDATLDAGGSRFETGLLRLRCLRELRRPPIELVDEYVVILARTAASERTPDHVLLEAAREVRALPERAHGAIPGLVLVLADVKRSTELRGEAATTLAILGPPAKEAISALEKLAQDPNRQLAVRAQAALRQIRVQK